MEPNPTGDATRVMTLYGQAMTRAGSIFAIGMMAIVPFGIASLAVTTRFLEPADFGRLAVLYAVASVLTVLSGLGIFQGTLITVYGAVDDDDGGGDGEVAEDTVGAPQKTSEERRRILGSGLLTLIGMATAICTAIALLGAALATAVLDDRWITAIAWMSASAWAGAIWRMVHQVPRMERRPVRWALLQFLRPGFVLVGTVAALAAGLGIDGVLMATALGTLVACVIAYLSSRRCFRFQPRWADVSMLWKQGRSWVPLTLATVVQANVSVLVLAVLATPASVGLFQVANRIAQIPSYFADGFLTGWPAMERSPISLAAKDRKGKREYSAAVFTLFCLITLGLLFAVSILSGILIHVAAPSYDSAAALIPIVAAAYGAHAVFRGAYRATSFPLRRYWYMLLHLLWIAPYAAVAALLIPLDPSYGVAFAQVIAGIVVSIAFVVVDRRGSQSTPFQWRRLGLALAIACACLLLAHYVPVPPALRVLLSVAALVAFPAFLLLTGAIGREQIEAIRSIASSVLPRRIRKGQLRKQLSLLPGPERSAVALVVCERQSVEVAAEKLDVSPPLVLARMVRGLRQVSGDEKATPIDHLIGEYVLHPGTTIERDAWAAHLRAVGVDPLHLHVLDEAKRTMSRLRGTLDAETAS
jgi:O-antigen/teichoic acid export membrane protein